MEEGHKPFVQFMEISQSREVGLWISDSFVLCMWRG